MATTTPPTRHPPMTKSRQPPDSDPTCSANAVDSSSGDRSSVRSLSLSVRSVLAPLRLRGGCMNAGSCCDDPVPMERQDTKTYTPTYRIATNSSVPRTYPDLTDADIGDPDADPYPDENLWTDPGFVRVKTRDSARLSIQATLASEELARIASGASLAAPDGLARSRSSGFGGSGDAFDGPGELGGGMEVPKASAADGDESVASGQVGRPGTPV